MKLTISGYSTALFSTFYFIEELKLLFDAGDGVISNLLAKSGKIKHVFISHADRDHMTGLLQFIQLNAKKEFPIIYYPKDSGSFSAFKAFSQKFDHHVPSIPWQGLSENQEILLNKEIVVRPVINSHIITENNLTKSFSYHVESVKKKLKPELINLSPEEIQETIKSKGRDFITMEVRENIMSYSGDTPVDNYERFKGTKILIHEATFMNKEEIHNYDRIGNKHSTIEEVFDMVKQLDIEKLILGHFSSRYSDEQINNKIRQLIKNHGIKIPVYRILPGKFVNDILNQSPIN